MAEADAAIAQVIWGSNVRPGDVLVHGKEFDVHTNLAIWICDWSLGSDDDCRLSTLEFRTGLEDGFQLRQCCFRCLFYERLILIPFLA